MTFLATVLASIAACSFAGASPLADYVITPGGYFHKDCVHQFDQPFHVIDETVYLSNGTVVAHPPCPHTQATSRQLYYSGWIGVASYMHDVEFDSFQSKWTVPLEPKSTSLLTTTFFFNGLEDQSPGAALILQPVLQYGFSGCGGGEHWTFTAFLVNDAGRAYCGKMMTVKAGDVLVGNMTKTAPGQWEVIAIANGVQSVYSTSVKEEMKYACITMEIIRCYSCGCYPADNAVNFVENHLVAKGETVRPVWQSKVAHTECGQDVTYDTKGADADDVTIHYNKSQ